MKKTTTRRQYAAAALACFAALAITSITVYAAWNYLKPDQVIENIFETEEPMLAEAFSEENAIYINETQSYGGYDVTLLGVTSGQSLTQYQYFADDADVTQTDSEDGAIPLKDRSYAIFAIENKNSEDAPELNEFQVFPIVAGYDYEICNELFLRSSGGRSVKKDGVLYYMHECNSLELFADHAVYLCVSDDLPAFSEYSYIYDSASGILARNVQYEGLNALFSLPLDASKADPKAADEKAEACIEAYEEYQKVCEDYLKTCEQEGILNAHPSDLPTHLQKAFEFADQITPENIDAYATLISDEGTFFPDAQGRVDIRYSGSYGGGAHMKVVPEDLFSDGKTEAVQYTGVSDSNPDTLYVEYFKLNEDGSISLKLYSPNLPESCYEY